MDPWDEKTHMSRQTLHRHFPTAVWLGRQIAAELRSLMADCKKSFHRETALSPLEWGFVPVMCITSAAFGNFLGCALAMDRGLLSWQVLVYLIGAGMPVGLIAAVPIAIMARACFHQVMIVLLVGNVVLAAGTGIAMFLFISASGAC
jgi:hypothetical protein